MWHFEMSLINKNDIIMMVVYPTGLTRLTLFHLSEHMVNRHLRKNRKAIPKILSGKTLFKNVTLQILNFIPVS